MKEVQYKTLPITQLTEIICGVYFSARGHKRPPGATEGSSWSSTGGDWRTNETTTRGVGVISVPL